MRRSRAEAANLNTPGDGHIDLSRLVDSRDPAVAKDTFTLSARFKAPASGERRHSIRDAAHPATWYFLFPGPFTGRKTAFQCYAGHQIEDIEASLD